MKLKKTKPSGVGKRHLGQQHNFRGHAAYGNYTKPLVKKSRPPLPSPAEFYASQIVDFVERGDDWAWGCCPFHDDHNPSFCMNLRPRWPLQTPPLMATQTPPGRTVEIVM